MFIRVVIALKFYPLSHCILIFNYVMNLYRSCGAFRVAKCKRLWWVTYVDLMGGPNSYRILVWKPFGK